MIQARQQPTLANSCATNPASDQFPGRWWHRDDDRIVCDLCPRECSLRDGTFGFCFVRQNVGDVRARIQNIVGKEVVTVSELTQRLTRGELSVC